MYTLGHRFIVCSIKGAMVDSMIPVTLIHLRRIFSLRLDGGSGLRWSCLKMAFISRGTPGRQKISVLLVFSLTAGAVPTGLGMALA